MLATQQKPGSLKRADNLLPRANGALYTRPAAKQVATGTITAAAGWGHRVLMEKNGRTVLWDGFAEHDLGQVGKYLQAAPFQAFAGNGQREDRLYVADGVNPLWYVRHNGSGWERVTVVNTITDASGSPYPLPVPVAIANWRNRLWITDGSKRVQHCQNEGPEEWDPLWTIEVQGGANDLVRALKAHGEMLAVGLDHAVWGITGTSQYNWEKDELVPGLGAVGPDGMVSDGLSLAYLNRGGLFLLGNPSPQSDDLRDLFESGVYGAQLAIDVTRRLLFMLLRGRVLAMHLDAPGQFSEPVVSGAAGLVQLQDGIGWYGSDGLWLLGIADGPDWYADGTTRTVTTIYETWDEQPNEDGAGRALLNRLRLSLSAPPGALIQYEANADGNPFAQWFTFRPDDPKISLGTYVTASEVRYPRGWAEIAPRLAGQFFRQRLTATKFLEIHQFSPDYRFGAG